MLSAKQMNAIFGTPAPVPAMSEARQKERELQIEGIDARQDSDIAGTDLALAADERQTLAAAARAEAEVAAQLGPADEAQQNAIDAAEELRDRLQVRIRETLQRGGITAGEASLLRTEMNSLAASARILSQANLSATDQRVALAQINQDAADARDALAGPATPQTQLLLDALNDVDQSVQGVDNNTVQLPALLRAIQLATEAAQAALDPAVTGSFADQSLNLGQQGQQGQQGARAARGRGRDGGRPDRRAQRRVGAGRFCGACC